MNIYVFNKEELNEIRCNLGEEHNIDNKILDICIKEVKKEIKNGEIKKSCEREYIKNYYIMENICEF